LDVNSEVIKQHGVVSDRCAKAMVLGCAEKFDTDCAIAITGIAGPGGGTEEKPVGLVYICILVKGQLRVFKYIFPGKRNVIRAKAAQMALFDLYSMLKML
jgi:nicotinamide-nucleotide amidase